MTTMTLATFSSANADVAAAPGSSVTISRRGHGGFTLATRDEHAASAVEFRARRAGLWNLRTVTDDGTIVVGVKGFAA